MCCNLGSKSVMELFELFIDDGVLNQIVDFTNKYANDNNIHETVADIFEMKRFIGILLLSGYHTLPNVESYWSSQPDLGIPIVKKAMTRKKFQHIKRFLHVSDNEKLDGDDRFAKVRPLLDILNERFLQFGVFHTHLSIDEQMVPYFGRHSCKMFIRGKPIRFGFKYWCLCGSDGYLYQAIPYAGASVNYNKQIGLGAHVVLELLKSVHTPGNHRVYFDNFFSSYYLMCLLNERGFHACGTIRRNRMLNVNLKTGKHLKRGEHDYRFDTTNEILLAKWNDNSEVNMITNYETIEPLKTARRYDRKQKKTVIFHQPRLIHAYNQHMGGVDLHDNAAANYRINIRGKKWWWPLFTHALNTAVVNAWKLHCFVSKRDPNKVKALTQLEFRSLITKQLLTSFKPEDEDMPNDFDADNAPDGLVDDSVKSHLIETAPDGKARRCRHCHKHTTQICKRCNVHLHAKCFIQYVNHQNTKK